MRLTWYQWVIIKLNCRHYSSPHRTLYFSSNICVLFCRCRSVLWWRSVLICSSAPSLSESRAGSCSWQNCCFRHWGPKRITMATKNICWDFLKVSVELKHLSNGKCLLFCITKLADMSHSLFEIHYCNIHKQLEKSKQTNRIKKFCSKCNSVFWKYGHGHTKTKTDY